MRNLILSAAMAATALGGITLPATASAQPGRGDWHDNRNDNWRDERREDARDVRDARRDVREERGELRDAWRRGDRDDIREERRDVRRAENRYSRELRDYRHHNPRIYDRGNWRADYRYRHWNRGDHVHRHYYVDRRYYINDPWRYRLYRTPSYLQWIRNYDDVLLVDIRNGRVIEVYYNFFW